MFNLYSTPTSNRSPKFLFKPKPNGIMMSVPWYSARTSSMSLTFEVSLPLASIPVINFAWFPNLLLRGV